MWVRLGNEYLNLDHVLRVRFNTGWKNGQEELVAELETLTRGDIQLLTRYRGPDAVILQALLGEQHQLAEQRAAQLQLAALSAGDASSRNTLPEM